MSFGDPTLGEDPLLGSGLDGGPENESVPSETTNNNELETIRQEIDNIKLSLENIRLSSSNSDILFQLEEVKQVLADNNYSNNEVQEKLNKLETSITGIEEAKNIATNAQNAVSSIEQAIEDIKQQIANTSDNSELQQEVGILSESLNSKQTQITLLNNLFSDLEEKLTNIKNLQSALDKKQSSSIEANALTTEKLQITLTEIEQSILDISNTQIDIKPIEDKNIEQDKQIDLLSEESKQNKILDEEQESRLSKVETQLNELLTKQISNTPSITKEDVLNVIKQGYAIGEDGAKIEWQHLWQGFFRGSILTSAKGLISGLRSLKDSWQVVWSDTHKGTPGLFLGTGDINNPEKGAVWAEILKVGEVGTGDNELQAEIYRRHYGVNPHDFLWIIQSTDPNIKAENCKIKLINEILAPNILAMQKQIEEQQKRIEELENNQR